ncbi:serine/threonine-protein kinase drkB [Phytophthora nicotianae]|uniref:Serine/threonine-protein kinase drkB n=1 Tax=Phytophthora nicotianae TaxID=4792 RepID=A0A0W8D4S9_PHYNI|nr:serine/threonine-protein kinase drkB [Phytophthora nicotianae]
MRNRGYVMIELEGDDMVVTCHKGVLRCSYENPNKKAHYDAAENVTCPEITYLEGVQAQTTTADDESAAGTVKAADIST